LILQLFEAAGAGEVHVIGPLAHRRAAALELGAKDVFATADGFVSDASTGPSPPGYLKALLYPNVDSGGRLE
jgi:hypothetical protein